jgi:predicted phage-related endonuclease
MITKDYLAIESTPEIDFLLHEIARDNAELRAIDAHKKRYMEQLLFLVGDATKIMDFGGEFEVATWSEVITNYLDDKALMKAHPRIYKKFMKKRSAKRLVIKKEW